VAYLHFKGENTMATQAQEYALKQVEHIKPFWISAAGVIVLTPGMLQDYLALAFMEGALATIDDIKSAGKIAQGVPA
jgi:UPF0716 family protein affecting phage T7 exclusion